MLFRSNTSLFNVSVMIMLPYLLMLREIMTFMMWNKLKNLLLGRVHSKLLLCLKILMMHLINMRLMVYLNFALIITRNKMAIFLNISSPKKETNALQEPMEKEIAETRSSLDEKTEESDAQEEE